MSCDRSSAPIVLDEPEVFQMKFFDELANYIRIGVDSTRRNKKLPTIEEYYDVAQ